MLEEFRLLEKHGFKLLPYKVVKTLNEAVATAEKMGCPVAMKVVSSEISHKTDVGGVKINIRNHIALKLAFKEIMENAKGKMVEGILIQKMARKGVELIVGGKKDPQFGYMVVLGLGGIYVEVFRDISARICPINEKDVEEMVQELKAHPLITGARGKKPINFKSLKQLLIRTCGFLKKEDIKELDLNPVVFDSKGCDIIDVRFTR